MVKIRNLLPGILHIPTANLRFQGFAVTDVPEITPDIQSQIDAGLVSNTLDENVESPPSQTNPIEPPADFDMLDEAEAIEYVEDETDANVIQSILQNEQRGGVIDALKARLKEIEDARE